MKNKADTIESRFNKLKHKFYNENGSKMPTEDNAKLGDIGKEESEYCSKKHGKDSKVSTIGNDDIATWWWVALTNRNNY